jgi:hypothetical protein
MLQLRAIPQLLYLIYKRVSLNHILTLNIEIESKTKSRSGTAGVGVSQNSYHMK